MTPSSGAFSGLDLSDEEWQGFERFDSTRERLRKAQKDHMAIFQSVLDHDLSTIEPNALSLRVSEEQAKGIEQKTAGYVA